MTTNHEAKKSDEVSPHSAELFHLIVENIKDYAIFMTDPTGVVVSWNPGVEKLLGYKKDEIVGQPIAIIYTPEDRANGAHIKEIELAAAEGRSENKRWHLRKDNSRFWANGLVMPIRNDDGSLRGFAKVIREDTAQKLAEEKLVQAKRYTEEILSSIADGFYTFDRDLRYVYVNKATTEMFGLPETAFYGKKLDELFPDAEGNIFHQEIKKVLDTGEPRVFENYYPPYDRWFENRVYPSPEGLSVFTTEITQRKRNEAAIRESEEKYRTLFDSIDEGFCIIEMIFDERGKAVDYTFIDLNGAFERHSGLVNAKGKRLREFVPDYEDFWFETYGRVATTRESVRFDNYSEAFDRWWDVYALPVGKPEKHRIAVLFNDITQRKRAEIALRQSEEKYRTLFNSIDEGFCVIEVLFDKDNKPNDYRFWEINPSFEKLTGLSAQDTLAGKTMVEMVPDFESKWSEIYGRVVQTGEPVRFVEGSDALNRWFDVYAFPTGKPGENRVAVLFNDITTRKQTEKTLSEAEQRYRALVEASATTVWHADPEGALTFVGDEWTRISGQSKEEVLKWGWIEAVHSEDRERVIEVWQNSLKNKIFYSTDFRILTVDKEYRWFTVSAVPVFDADGGVREWIGSTTDITPRKRAEEERAESRKLLEAERARLAYIFNNAPAFVAVLRGSEHIFELTNPAYLQLIGHREVIGKTVREGLPDIAGQGYYELLDRVYETGEAFKGSEMAVELQREPNGLLEKRFINFVYQPIFGTNGKSDGIFVHGVDITDQVEARQQAETANRLKDEFLATLSHELRTPLNAILGWSQILKLRNLNEAETQKALETIERSARAQNQLIEDILDVSRIITGKLRLDVRAVDLPSVIEAAMDAARPAAEAKAIRLQSLLDPQAGPISGDPDRLQQVVWNLLSNAIKFTDKGGRVQVRLERVNSHIEITVSDTGKGIESEFLPHVFDRFRQSDGSMTRRHGGLGLGLAIVRQLIELHGGMVSVESAGEGKGSTFIVNLPLMPVRREPSSVTPRVHPSASENDLPDCSAELNGLHILLVDDEADSRELLKVVLSTCGAFVKTASSAAEAFELVTNEKFDVIVSDIGMPEEDGFTLMSKIRALPQNQGGSVPAIALTAYARAEDRVQALRAGFQMHIAKPVEPTELIAVVANLSGRIKIPN